MREREKYVDVLERMLDAAVKQRDEARKLAEELRDVIRSANCRVGLPRPNMDRLPWEEK